MIAWPGGPLSPNSCRSIVNEENKDIESRLIEALQYELLVWLEEQNRILREKRLWQEWKAEEEEREWEQNFDYEWIDQNR